MARVTKINHELRYGFVKVGSQEALFSDKTIYANTSFDKLKVGDIATVDVESTPRGFFAKIINFVKSEGE